MNKAMDLDGVDRRLLGSLMADGRASWSDLAADLGITAPAVAQRVRRLQARGVIKQFAAWVEPRWVAPVSAFVTVSLEGAGVRSEFCERVEHLETVQECHRLAGEDDYLLKVRCRSLSDLEELLGETLPALPGVALARASVVLSTSKETPILPLPEADRLPL